MAFNIDEYVKTEDYVQQYFVSAFAGALATVSRGLARDTVTAAANVAKSAVLMFAYGEYMPVKTTAEADRITRGSVFSFPNFGYIFSLINSLTETDILTLLDESEKIVGGKSYVNDETTGGTVASESTRATTANDKYNPVNTVSGRIGNESTAQETASGSTRTTGERGATGTEDTESTVTRSKSRADLSTAFYSFKNAIADYAVFFRDGYCYTAEELEDGYYFGVIE